MEEGGCVGSDGASSSSSALLNGGGRQRFEVELRPEETTIVSWKKLMKDTNKAASNSLPPSVPAPPMPPAVAVNQALDPLNAPPGEPAENEGNDAAPGSRFGAVIKKIECLYMGKNSSDEEDLNDVVPDDDEYDTEDSFIDDTELDDYFQVDDSQIKHDGCFVNRGKLERATVSQNEPTALPNHQRKKRRKDSEKVNGGNDSGQPTTQKVKNKEAGKAHTPVDKNFPISSKSKASSTIISSSSEAIIMAKNIDKQKVMVCQPKDHGSKLKMGSPSSVAPLQKSNDNSSHVQSRSHSGLLLNNSEELNQSLLIREKNVIREQSEAKATRTTQQTMQKNPLMVRKEGSNTKPKSTMLEKAIRDLEKTVMESRPPSVGVADADTCSPAVKKRMPPEIKHKLAKVARLAHANHGKISKELLNRLMSIVGHLIQLRSLRGLDEDAGPQVRKLYAELAELWPQGLMDNHGIRGAICRAEDRRKALNKHKGQEKLKRKKIVPTKTNTIHICSSRKQIFYCSHPV